MMVVMVEMESVFFLYIPLLTPKCARFWHLAWQCPSPQCLGTWGRKEKRFQSTVPGAKLVWENLGVCQHGHSNVKAEGGVE